MDELDFQERREVALVKSEKASEIIHAFANADPTETIVTQTGPLKPLSFFHQKVEEVTNEVDLLVSDVADLLDTLP